MKRFTAVLILLTVSIAGALAQPVVISGQDSGYNADSPYNRLYDTKTVITVKGRVAGVEVAPPMRSMGNIITILVKAGDGKTWHVDVGPEWYVDNQRTKIKIDDHVQVTGSRVTIDDHSVILAEQIVKNKNVLALRRPMGRPYWDATYTQAPPDDGINHRIVDGTITNIATFIDGTNGVTEVWTIHTDDGDVRVAVAPDWYYQRQKALAQMAVGSFVDVNLFAPTGRPIPGIGQGLVAPPVVFATSVSAGNQWTVVRSPGGVPIWYGGQ